MTDKIEELIREIAVKHNIAIGRDDPILMLHTIMNYLIVDSAAEQQRVLNQYKGELEDITQRWGNTAQEKAERILNTSLAASKEALTRHLQDSAKMNIKVVQNAIQESLTEANSLISSTEKIAKINLLSLGGILITACIGVAGFLLR